MKALHGGVLRGLSIGCMPDFLAAARHRTGDLSPLLIDRLDAPGQFNPIWSSSRHLSPNVWVSVYSIAKRLFSSEFQVAPMVNQRS
ncbi:hypothetical protein [Rhizobium tumorigenes]|uniref:hypothetical protein n=1 Tax=Rhizobium tumorigenes TaxID=2041385 RepID=UPI003BF9839E